MPFILWRYILREIAIPTLLTLVALALLLLLDDMPGPRRESPLFILIGMLLRPEVDRADLTIGFLSILPTIVAQIIGWVFLVGIIIGVGRMTMDREVRSMQTGGMNLLYIFLPVLILGGLLSGGAAWLTYEAQPRLLHQATARVTRLMATQLSRLEPGRVYEEGLLGDGNEMRLQFRRTDPATGRMRGVTLMLDRRSFLSDAQRERAALEMKARLAELENEWTEGRIGDAEKELREYEIHLAAERQPPIPFFAAEAAFVADLNRGVIGLDLFNGSLHVVDSGASAEIPPEDDPASEAEAGRAMGQYMVLQFGRVAMAERFDDGAGRRHRFTVMTVPELRRRQLDGESVDARREARAEILHRYSNALSVIALAFVGLPLAVWIRPSGKSVGVFLAAALIVLYHLLLETGVTMVESSDSPWGPWLTFSPVAVFGLTGIGLWWRAMRT